MIETFLLSTFIVSVITIVKYILYDHKLFQTKAVAETALGFKTEENQKLEELLKKQSEEVKILTNQKAELNQELELAKQKLDLMLKQVEDWKKDQEQYLELTRGSILKAGSELSSKLLDDHKRENEDNAKKNAKELEETTKNLHEQFKTVFESMHLLHSKIGKVEIIERALLNPQGAGSLAEITLENILKASGLIENQDYYLQYHLKGEEQNILRPDAVIFLPQNQAIIIDSKASKFFTELGYLNLDNQENDEQKNEQKKKIEVLLKQTMQNHLKALTTRNYKSSMIEHLQKLKNSNQNFMVTVMMFLPTEVTLEKFRNIDRSFEEKAWQNNIILVGPAGLVNALLQAKQAIFIAKQNENSAMIVAEVKKLLTAIANFRNLSESLGKTIKSSFEKYDKFAASFNSNFLSKVKKLEHYGVNSQNDKHIERLERYQVISAQNLIEAEVEVTEEIENVSGE